MNEKSLRWHSETLIGHATSNNNYWGQYDRLVYFIFDEFPKTKTRLEVIAAPLLHLISHSLELGYKSNIRYFQKYNNFSRPQNFTNWNFLYKAHRVHLLHNEFGFQIQNIFSQFDVEASLISEFNGYFSKAEKLIQLLKINTETYRYAEKLDNSGNVVGRVINKDESINILDVKELFKPTMIMLSHSCDVFGIYTDYVDFQQEFPDFQNGKGYLFMNKYSNSGDSEYVISRLTKNFTKIKDNLWFFEEENEYFTSFISEDYLYVVPIKDINKFNPKS